MLFKYKKKSRRLPRMNINRLPSPTGFDERPLTGWVHGKQASDIEERFARALDKIGRPYQFQVDMPSLDSRMGDSKSIDFVVDVGSQQPVEIDGAFAHKSAAQKGADQIRDANLNIKLAEFGWLPIIRVEDFRLDTQDLADQYARGIL